MLVAVFSHHRYAVYAVAMKNWPAYIEQIAGYKCLSRCS